MRRLDLHRRNVKLARARWGLNRGHVALEILKCTPINSDSRYRWKIPPVLRPELVRDTCWFDKAFTSEALLRDRSTPSG